MKITLNTRPKDLEEKLKELAPWGHYFKFDDKTITGYFAAKIASEEEVLRDPTLTFCTKNDSDSKVDMFNSAYDHMITNSTRQFMLIDILKKLMGSDFYESTAYDFGCNDGMKSFYMKEAGIKEVTGFEYREDCIQRANYINEVSGLNVNFINHKVSADTQEYTQGIEPADIVSSFGILHHLKNHRQHIKSLRAVTKKVLVLHSSFVRSQKDMDLDMYEESKNSFKSITGERLIPNLDDLMDMLYEEGFSYVLRVQHNASMGSKDYTDGLDYWVAVV